MATIAWYGDSTIYGYDGAAGGGRVATPIPEGFQALLPQNIVTNNGVNSTRTSDLINGTNGFVRTWAAEMAASTASIVYVCFGINDQFDMTTTQFKSNLASIATTAITAGKRIVFQTPNPTHFSGLSEYVSAMRDQAMASGVACIDVFSHVISLLNGNAVTTMMPDGIHPNQNTYTAITQYIAANHSSVAPDDALLHADRVRETTTTTGTGTLTLAGAITGHRTFASVATSGSQFYGAIVAVDAVGNETGQWETGLYTYNNGTVVRTTPHAGSAGVSTAVNFAAGTKHVFPALTAAQVRAFKQTSVVTQPPSSGGTVRPTYAGSTAQQQAFWDRFTDYTIFQDEFDGAALDTNKWAHGEFFGPAARPDLVRVTGGKLQIGTPSTGDVTIRIISQQFRAGYYVEGRSRLCAGPGTWPGFWLIETEGDEATHRAEPDIFEAYPGMAANWNGNPANGGIGAGQFDFTIHPVSNAGGTGDPGVQHVSVTDPTLSNQMHTYGMWHRKDGHFELYFDGVLRWTSSTIPVLADRALTLEIDIYDQARIGGPAIGNAPQGFDNPLEFEYVRVWGEK